MTQTLKKTLAGLTVAALMFMGAASVKAATVEDLQDQIDALLAQLAGLSGGSSCTATYNHTVTLMVGSKGSQVSAMQAVVGAGTDGNFGPMTKSKVMAFQASKGLTADGVVGAMTGAALKTASMTNCDPDTNPDTTPNGPLEGDFGTISDVNTLSQYSSEDVGEGEEEVIVAGFEVEASNDGDIMLTSMKITFDQTGNGSGDSDNLDDYIDGVTIWMGDEEIASADVDDFTENSSDTFSKTIALDDSIVRADDTEKFYISVDAAGTFDSGDIDSDSWTVFVDNLRYEDGDGVVTTDTTAGDLGAAGTGIGSNGTAGDGVPLDFVTFSTSADTELQFSTDSDSPEAGIVVVDDSDSTDGVTLLTGSIELEGTSDVVIDELPVTLTTSGATDLDEITGSLTLIIDGEEYSESVSTSTLTTTTVTFNNLDFTLAAGDTIDFEIQADINDIEVGSFEEGDMLKVDIQSGDIVAMDVENEEGDQLADSEKSGTATGEYQEFRTQGIMLELVSTDAESSNDTGALNDTGTFEIKFKVTAIGDDAYVATHTPLTYYPYTVDIAGTATTAGVSAAIINNTDTDLTSAYNWLIEEGESETLTLTVSKTNSAGVANVGLTRVNLTGVKWDDTDDNTPDNTYSSNMDDFHTNYISMN